MRQYLSRFGALVRGRLGALAFVMALLLGVASVRADPTPPTMPAVVFPVDTASIVTAITTAGIAILLLVFSATIGFRLVRKLFKRISGAM